MTLEQYDNDFCGMCGTQRCGGAFDEVGREGCEKFYDHFPELVKDTSAIDGIRLLRHILEELY